MKILDFDTRDMLIESRILADSTYQDFRHLGMILVEKKLTDQEIQNLFKSIETGATAGGANRTFIGKTKDVATDIAGAISKAYNGVADKISRSGPVSGFDVAVDKLMDKIKSGAGGEGGTVMKAVYKYREFAKKHPVMQGAIYAGLIALAGLSGAGLGGAALLGGIKAFDKMLLGNKASSSLWSGFVTGATAYGLGKLSQAMAGQPGAAAPATPGTPDASTAATAAPAPEIASHVVKSGDTLSQIAKDSGVSVQDIMGLNPQLTNPDVLKVGQEVLLPSAKGSVYQGGVGTAADTLSKIASGDYADSAISRAAAARAGLKEMRISVKRMPLKEMVDRRATLWQWQLNESVGKKSTQRSVHLTPAGVDHVFSVMESYQRQFFTKINELRNMPSDIRGPGLPRGRPANLRGPGLPLPRTTPPKVEPAADTATGPGRGDLPDYYRPTRPGAPVPGDEKPGFWSRMGQGLANLGKQFTTRVTADKLNMNWKVAGSPTDSAELFNFLVKQGVPNAVAIDAYEKMGLPLPGGPEGATPGAADMSATLSGMNDEQILAWIDKTKAGGVGEDDPIIKQARQELEKRKGAGGAEEPQTAEPGVDEPKAGTATKMKPDDIVAQLKAVWDKVTDNQENPIGAPAVRQLIKSMWMQTGGTQAMESRRKNKTAVTENKKVVKKQVWSKSGQNRTA